MIGTTIGNYRIVTELGAGAMGEVYYAEHQTMGRRAAIKVLRDEVCHDQDVVGRFMNEARAVNDIKHPHIVEITDFGEVDGRHYLIMELLEGESLEERVEREKRLSPVTAAKIGAQIAAGLQAAHDAAVVHRDLKPENVFLTHHNGSDDFVKVVDFGVAKLMPQHSGSMNATMPGQVIGTPYYMSPEQCRGDKNLGPSSDIYSLGCVLYELVTGQPPFDGETLAQLILAHIHKDAPPASFLCPEVPQWLDQIIMRCLEKRPQDRFHTMADLQQRLELQQPPPMQGQWMLAAEEDDGPEDAEETDAEQHARVAGKLSGIILKRLQDDNLKLPTMPQAAMDAIRLLDGPRYTFKRLASTIESDPILCSQVLKLANSTLLGAMTKAQSLEQALPRLGERHLKLLLVEASSHQLFQSRNVRIRNNFRGVWNHCLAVALLARDVAKLICHEAPDEVYLAGLLHDIGKPVTGSLLIEAEKNLEPDDQKWMTADVWLKSVNECHRDIGTSLARLWCLPDEVVRTIKNSEKYSLSEPRCIANVVCFANAVTKRRGLYPTPIDEEEVARVIAHGSDILGVPETVLEDPASLAEKVAARPDFDSGNTGETALQSVG